MLEPKDPAIKLFGRTIPVLDIPARSGESAGAHASSSCDVAIDGTDQNRASSTHSYNTNNRGGKESEIDKDTVREELVEESEEDGALVHTLDEIANLDSSSRLGEESLNPCAEKEATLSKTSMIEEQTQSSQEKVLKKPDKILPCPRCNSMDTKFCYYNNYNVNQPRYFCKNCQRYWTAGGAIRNVPVGAGRRKNKNTASHHNQMPEASLQNSQSDLPNGIQHPSLNCNGAVLKFGTDTRLCESMTSVLNLADKTLNNDKRSGFNRPEEPRIPVPYASGEKGNDHPDKSAIMSTQPMEGATINKSQEQTVHNFQSFPAQVPYFSCAPWPFPWNSAQWSSSPVPPPTSFPPPGFTVPFYPAPAYWGCIVSSTWNMPWIVQPSSPHSSASNSGPNSPTLGKHSREENSVKSSDVAGGDGHSKETIKEKNLWVPKTLRIDDLGEAAKSSIWTTLGIKSNEADSIQEEGIFKAFPSKVDEKVHEVSNSEVLQANPAALSRSINFHET